MILPYLHFLDNTPVTITLTDGIDENGAPNVITTFQGLCCYSEKSKTVMGQDGQVTTINGKIMIGCDIAPLVPALAGTVQLNNREWKIYSASRPRNPDGSVNHTELELM